MEDKCDTIRPVIRNPLCARGTCGTDTAWRNVAETNPWKSISVICERRMPTHCRKAKIMGDTVSLRTVQTEGGGTKDEAVPFNRSWVKQKRRPLRNWLW